MAWIDVGPYYEWDIDYTDQARAAARGYELAEQYKIFTTTARQEDGTFRVVTQNTITEEHSTACRCNKCVPFL